MSGIPSSTSAFNSLPTTNGLGKARREVINGREFLIAPMTLIVPGVLNGSQGALYYPPEEIRRNPTDWNGLPMVVLHPTRNGVPISGRSPEAFAKQEVGRVYNTKVGTGDRLQAEGWFDVEHTRRVDPTLVPRLEKGEPIELSTGLFTSNVPGRGVYNGREYVATAREYRPDHLAVLPDRTGACSVRDGCGVLVNEAPSDVRDLSNLVLNHLGPSRDPNHYQAPMLRHAPLGPSRGTERPSLTGVVDLAPSPAPTHSANTERPMTGASPTTNGWLDVVADLVVENCGGPGGKPGPCPTTGGLRKGGGKVVSGVFGGAKAPSAPKGGQVVSKVLGGTGGTKPSRAAAAAMKGTTPQAMRAAAKQGALARMGGRARNRGVATEAKKKAVVKFAQAAMAAARSGDKKKAAKISAKIAKIQARMARNERRRREKRLTANEARVREREELRQAKRSLSHAYKVATLVANAVEAAVYSSDVEEQKLPFLDLVANKMKPSTKLAKDGMTPDKACKILSDGEANGVKLSKKQKGMFGALCGKRDEATKNEEGISSEDDGVPQHATIPEPLENAETENPADPRPMKDLVLEVQAKRPRDLRPQGLSDNDARPMSELVAEMLAPTDNVSILSPGGKKESYFATCPRDTDGQCKKQLGSPMSGMKPLAVPPRKAPPVTRPSSTSGLNKVVKRKALLGEESGSAGGRYFPARNEAGDDDVEDSPALNAATTMPGKPGGSGCNCDCKGKSPDECEQCLKKGAKKGKRGLRGSKVGMGPLHPNPAEPYKVTNGVVGNIFCKTGPGGGINPSCGAGGKMASGPVPASVQESVKRMKGAHIRTADQAYNRARDDYRNMSQARKDFPGKKGDKDFAEAVKKHFTEQMGTQNANPSQPRGERGKWENAEKATLYHAVKQGLRPAEPTPAHPERPGEGTEESDPVRDAQAEDAHSVANMLSREVCNAMRRRGKKAAC